MLPKPFSNRPIYGNAHYRASLTSTVQSKSMTSPCPLGFNVLLAVEPAPWHLAQITVVFRIFLG